jgi:hypothetical protein
MVFFLKGPKGTIQFMVGTNWHLPRVAAEMRARPRSPYDDTLMGWDVGYHSPVPMYEGQTPIKHDCTHTGGVCYYDGSGLLAEEWVPQFIAGGTDWLWPKMEEQYRLRFEEGDA